MVAQQSSTGRTRPWRAFGSRTAGAFIVTASAMVGVGLAAGQAAAAPYNPAPPVTVCSTTSQTPYFPPLPVSNLLRVGQSGRVVENPTRRVIDYGKVDFEFLNANQLFTPAFDQTVRFTWRNLDSGKTGVAIGRTPVRGEVSIAYAERVHTGPGRIVVRADVTNRGQANTGSSGAVTRTTCSGRSFVVV